MLLPAENLISILNQEVLKGTKTQSINQTSNYKYKNPTTHCGLVCKGITSVPRVIVTCHPSIPLLRVQDLLIFFSFIFLVFTFHTALGFTTSVRPVHSSAENALTLCKSQATQSSSFYTTWCKRKKITLAEQKQKKKSKKLTSSKYRHLSVISH